MNLSTDDCVAVGAMLLTTPARFCLVISTRFPIYAYLGVLLRRREIMTGSCMVTVIRPRFYALGRGYFEAGASLGRGGLEGRDDRLGFSDE